MIEIYIPEKYDPSTASLKSMIVCWLCDCITEENDPRPVAYIKECSFMVFY